MSKTGPKTDLTKEMFKEIEQAILDGCNLKETAETVFAGIEKFKDLAEEEKVKELANFTQKIYNWNYDNYLNISDKIKLWRIDRKINLATNNLEEMLQMKTENSRVSNDDEVIKFVDTGLVRVKADMTKFALETLDRGNYSKRTENTGRDGEPLGVILYPKKNDEEPTNPLETA